MILTEDKTYTMSLELEDQKNSTGLTNNTVELAFTNKELLHAILTCGLPIQRMTVLFPEKRKLEAIYKLFQVENALDTEGDRLRKSKSIAYLDSSEKSLISYYMGMFFTKLLSRKLFDIEYLTNLNTIRRMDGIGYIDFFASEWRPEMIGFLPGENKWSVWEAKGGSNRREQALKKGTDQLNQIGGVNGTVPDPAAVCMTYYDHSYLCAVVREPGIGKGENLQFMGEDFYRSYYSPIRELFLDQGTGLYFHDDNAEIVLEVPYFPQEYREPDRRKVRMGMPAELLQELIREDYTKAAEVASKSKNSTSAPEDSFQGPDGIYIR